MYIINYHTVHLFHIIYSIFFFIQQVADLIGADPKEIVFTSGATESNNISVKVLLLHIVHWSIWKTNLFIVMSSRHSSEYTMTSKEFLDNAYTCNVCALCN